MSALLLLSSAAEGLIRGLHRTLLIDADCDRTVTERRIGSPFGYVDSARKLSSVLTTLALNTFPLFAPYGGAIVYLLNRSQTQLR